MNDEKNDAIELIFWVSWCLHEMNDDKIRGRMVSEAGRDCGNLDSFIHTSFSGNISHLSLLLPPAHDDKQNHHSKSLLQNFKTIISFLCRIDFGVGQFLATMYTETQIVGLITI